MNTEPTWRKGLRELIVLKLTELGPLTTKELANACQVSPDAIAPRMTELEGEGRARDTGRRKSSLSGKGRKLKVWEAAGERMKVER
jgi:predicted ArsR family transcriptional regulator